MPYLLNSQVKVNFERGEPPICIVNNVSNCAPWVPINYMNNSLVGILYVLSYINKHSFLSAIINYINV